MVEPRTGGDIWLYVSMDNPSNGWEIRGETGNVMTAGKKCT